MVRSVLWIEDWIVGNHVGGTLGAWYLVAVPVALLCALIRARLVEGVRR
jgi:hypothetical protein